MFDTAIPEEVHTPATCVKEDPLLADIELPFVGVFHPLGFSVEIATNCPDVLEAAEEAWRYGRKSFLEPPVELRIAVAPGRSRECPPPPVFRRQRKLFSLVADAENFMTSDLGQGFGFGWLTDATVQDRAFLRYHFIEGTVLGLLASSYLTPLHAACVQWNGKGILLCGDSGAGKSSLAYACARSGWTLICDDSSYIIRSRERRTVVGNPHQIRFRESATRLFPELQGLTIAPRPSGKLTIEVATASLPEIATAGESYIDYIVFLNRRAPGGSALASLPKESALRWFEQALCLGDEEIRTAQAASLHALLTAEVLELRYRDLDWAVQRLEMLTQERS
ncbi:MAG: HPr kinase/phosphorylase [Acidobacteriaceae bacterium]